MTGTPRCEWCGEPRRPAQKHTHSAACRAARWRWLRGLDATPPPWAESPLHGRFGEDDGLMVNYSRAVRAVQDGLRSYVMAAGHSRETADELIELALRVALSPAQRRKLEGQDA